MGKPVIATNYSGNVDFMDDSNSLLVPYELVELGKPLPPYAADFVWAEPSVEHAAKLMRQVFDDPEAARRLGASGGQGLKLPGGVAICLIEMRAAHERFFPAWMGS